MKRKAYFLFALILFLFCAAIRSILTVSGGAEYVAATRAQSLYQVDVAENRGTIYDCRLRPLVGKSAERKAAVAPTIEAVGALDKATDGIYRERLATALESGKPFVLSLDRRVESPFVDQFIVPRRYEEDQPAPHIIGYLDSMGKGVSGVELAMNDVLEENTGRARVTYQVDALGRVLPGGDRQVEDTLSRSRGGVELTIDADLQKLVEEAGQELQKGAVVVSEVPGCELRAVASFPDYSPEKIDQAAKGEDGALVNRAFCAYAPGSVFKLVNAAAILEQGTLPGTYTCTGEINSGGLLFHCYDGAAHGQVDLKAALEKSCNCFFINAARSSGGQDLLNMAYNLGLGAEQEFGRGLFTEAGELPSASSLENVRALANFSFGQGEVTLTPVQLCGVVNAIAFGGIYTSPRLIEGTVNSELELKEAHAVTDKSIRVMSTTTAAFLQDAMKAAALEGTGKPGAPESAVAGIKTGTAQTGRFENREELLHFWYCGFLCDEVGPRYSIVVLRESTTDDNGAAARVFKKIAEGIGEIAF